MNNISRGVTGVHTGKHRYKQTADQPALLSLKIKVIKDKILLSTDKLK